MSYKFQYFRTIDGWRALAILGVIVAHATPNQSLFYKITYYFGVHGVNIFFALSGFLICSRLIEEERSRGRICLRSFYLRRGFRILPPVLIFLGFLALVEVAGFLPRRSKELCAALLFYRNYLPLRSDLYTAHFWSLCVEEHFYLFWPGLLLLCGRRNTLRVVPVLCFGIAVRRWVAHHYLDRDSIYSRTDFRVDEILWGCVLALLLTDERWKPRLTKFLVQRTFLTLAVLYVVIVAFTVPLGTTLLAVLMPLIIASTVLNPSAPFARFLELPVLRWLGRLSYSLYLWQQIFFVAAIGISNGSFCQRFPFNVLTVTGISLASYYLIERPMIKLGYRLAPPATVGKPELASEP